jgi:mycothiol synthase
VLVYESAGRPVGYVTCRMDRQTRIGDVPHLMVAQGHQGEGIGKALLEAAMSRLRDSGMELVRIDCLEQNVRANRFYPSVGFVEVARKVYYVKRLCGR